MKADLNQVANNANHLNAEEITQLLIILKEFEDLFDGTLGDWATDPIDLDLKLGSNPFNIRYYPFPIINKEACFKELKRLV